jgi:hypothetical protein
MKQCEDAFGIVDEESYRRGMSVWLTLPIFTLDYDTYCGGWPIIYRRFGVDNPGPARDHSR